MIENLDLFAAWLRNTSVSEAIRLTPWLWPACEIVHFFGLSLLVGVVGFFDARLLGFLRQIPLGAAFSLLRWAKVGFALSAVTGVTFFVGAPEQYVNNAAFLGKVVFLAIAGANAAFFETRYGTRVLAFGASEETPRAFKVVALVSIVSWFFVIYWGRMLPFIGNAF